MLGLPRRRRHGCLGCLGSLVVVLALAVVIEMGLNALLAPYNFTMGGHFHWMPGWQGLARFHTATSGGDYVLWIRFNPTTPGYLKSPLNGDAYLCTPRGERFTLHMGGSMPRNTGRDLTGVPLHLYMFRYTVGAQLSGDSRPKIDLWGAFGDRVLTVDDHASVAHAFNADASLNDGHWGASRDEEVHFTLHEGSPWTLRPSCAAMLESAPSGDRPSAGRRSRAHDGLHPLGSS